MDDVSNFIERLREEEKQGKLKIFRGKEKMDIGEPLFEGIRDTQNETTNSIDYDVFKMNKSTTSFKAADENNQDDEGLLQNVFDAITDGISILDKELNIIRVNKFMKEMYSNHVPLEGKKCYQVYQQCDSSCPWCPSLRTLKTGEVQHETVPYPSDKKQERWLDLSSYPLKDKTGNIIGVIEYVKDITEIWKTEEKLKETKNHFQALFNSISDPVVIIDSKGKFLEITDRAEETTGFEKDDLIGKNFLKTKILTRKSKAICIKNLIKRMSGIDIPPYEVEVITKDGRKKPFEINARKIDYKGKPADMIVFRDISDRKKAEKKIRYLKDYNLNILESNPNPIIITKGNIVEFVNKSFLSTLGKTKDDYISKRLKEVIPSSMFPYFEDLMQDSKKKKEMEIKEKYFIVSSFIVKKAEEEEEEEEERRGIILQDITERKRLEDELKKSEQRFRDITNSMADWIWEVDKDGKYTFTSGKVKEILGYEPTELLGKTPFYLMPEDEAIRVGDIFKEIVSEKKPIVNLENWNLTKEGKHICLLTNGIPKLDEDGKLIGYRGVDKDITHNKKAEEQRKKSRKEMETLLKASSNGIRVITKDFKIKMMNETMANMAAITIEDGIGMKCSEMFGSQWCGTNHCSLIRVLQKGKGFEKDDIRKTMDGREIPCIDSVNPYRDEKGDIIGIIEDFRDITTIKETEQELRESEEKYRTYINTAPIGVFICDQQGKYLDANDAAIKITGYSKDELLHMNITDITAEDRKETAIKHFQTLKKSGESSSENQFVHKDGTIHWWTVNAVKLSDTRFLSFTQDITEQKKMEKELKENEFQYRSIFNSAKDIFLIFDFDGNIVDANKAAFETYGYSKEKFLTLSGKDIVHPDYHHIFNEFIKEVSEKGEFSGESVDIRKDGSTFPIEVRGTSFILNGKKHLLAVVRDVTEQKRAVEQLRKNLDELKRYKDVTIGREKRVVELKNEINTLYKKLGEPVKYRDTAEKLKQKNIERRSLL